jgi:hypothetical protein
MCFTCRLRATHTYCTKHNFRDNIGNTNFEMELAYGPIDAVYTWVNGSDPRWLEKKTHWQIIEHTLPGINSSIVTSNTSEDDSASNNRYRESNELRYSLRSLEKYAPWLRRIYIVTDNQIPNWVNLDNPRVKIITHEEIFPNKSHLPVFSSPAIESHLHLIPHLSKKFIYFNDDVFLGSPTLPDDFFSLAGTQKFHMSWDVPNCAPGCSDAWIGDGYCDKACNVSSCNFDFPDCINGSASNSRGSRYGNANPGAAIKNSIFCAPGCPQSWLGDKVCDLKCKYIECGWDMGDCGISMVTEDFKGVVVIPTPNSTKNHSIATPIYHNSNNHTLIHGNITTEEEPLRATIGSAKSTNDFLFPHVLTIPFGENAVYFNLSYLQCLALENHATISKTNNNAYDLSMCEREGIPGVPVSGGPSILTGPLKTSTGTLNFTYTDVEYTVLTKNGNKELNDMLSSLLIQNALLLQKHHIFIAILSKTPTTIVDGYASLYPDESVGAEIGDKRLNFLSTFHDPVEIRVSVNGYNSYTLINASTHFSFKISFEKSVNESARVITMIPDGMKEVSGHFKSILKLQNSANNHLLIDTVTLSAMPISTHKSHNPMCPHVSTLYNASNMTTAEDSPLVMTNPSQRLELILDIPHISSSLVNTKSIEILSKTTTILPSGVEYVYSEPICQSLSHTSELHRKNTFHRRSSHKSGGCINSTLGDLLYPYHEGVTSESSSFHLTVPMPVRWECFATSAHIYVKHELLLKEFTAQEQQISSIVGYVVWGGLPEQVHVNESSIDHTNISHTTVNQTLSSTNVTNNTVTDTVIGPPVVEEKKDTYAASLIYVNRLYHKVNYTYTHTYIHKYEYTNITY